VGRLSVVGGCFAAFGLVQFVTGKAWVNQLEIPGLIANTPIYAISLRDGFVRPFGTAIHPIEFGSVISMLLPLTIVHGLIGSRHRWLSWLPALMAALAAALSSSRSAILGVAIGLLLLWPALRPVQRVLGALGFAVLGVVVFVTVPGMVGSITGLFTGLGGDSSISSRVESYGTAGAFFQRYPVFGRGFATFLPRYRIFDNQYLLAAVETGVVGVACLVMLWVVPALGAARVIRAHAAGSPARLMATGLLSASVVGGVDMAFFDGFGFPMMPALWFVLLGLAGACYRLDATTSS